jgi:hypothetical protein
MDDGKLPELPPEVERSELIGYIDRLLQAMPLHQLRADVNHIAGSGTATRVLLQRRRQAGLAQRQLEEQIAEARRRDPHTVAKAEAWARSLTDRSF